VGGIAALAAAALAACCLELHTYSREQFTRSPLGLAEPLEQHPEPQQTAQTPFFPAQALPLLRLSVVAREAMPLAERPATAALVAVLQPPALVTLKQVEPERLDKVRMAAQAPVRVKVTALAVVGAQVLLAHHPHLALVVMAALARLPLLQDHP
jgi:hypothetical protein